MTRCIVYNSGYKYQLKASCSVATPIIPDNPIVTKFIELDGGGLLTLREGYAWDGPSGPTFDTLNFMRGSLVHDALYQLMRERHLDKARHRNAADRLLQRICEEDGMSKLRAWIVYQAVSRVAEPFADPANKRPPIRAPADCTA